MPLRAPPARPSINLPIHTLPACPPPLSPTRQAAGTAGKEVRVAVCSGIAYAQQLLKRMKAGEVHYDFVEVRLGLGFKPFRVCW